MMVQKNSTKDVIKRCVALGVKTVGGGPLFNCYTDEFPNVDHIVTGEGEITVPSLVKDIELGAPKKRYFAQGHPPLSITPIPMWDLINFKDYTVMCVQFSRGCPFDCEFCDIVIMNGHVPRTKSNEQMIAELNALYERGWKGSVFIVDDNFIGNKKKVKEFLRAIIKWQEQRPKRFTYLTEASVNLSEDEELMELMIDANFNKVFLGLETPFEDSLRECSKFQNLKRSLSESVSIIQRHGLAVMGGFIVGFDSDPNDIFERQVQFIQKSGVVTAMVSLLTAIPKTKLYQRLEKENRLLFRTSGNNTDVEDSLNFIPKMEREYIIHGYQWIMDTIYSPKMYYKRICKFLQEFHPRVKTLMTKQDVMTFIRSLWYLGIRERKGSRIYYWRLLINTLLHSRGAFGEVVTVLIYGYHFRKLFCNNLYTP